MMTMVPTMLAFTSAPAPTMSVSCAEISPSTCPSMRPVPSNTSFPVTRVPFPRNASMPPGVAGWLMLRSRSPIMISSRASPLTGMPAAGTTSRSRALVVERAEPLARTLTLEVGKPIAQAHRELAGILPRVDFFLAEVGGVLADEVVGAADGLEERIEREPLGVVANVSAWNYPWFVAANVFLPALLTGNAVVYKPSEFATLTGLAIAELVHEAGVPADCFQTVVGGGDVGAMLVEERVDAVCFTGSHATGVKVAAAVAPRLLRLQLELGGKDPVYVCDDVDVGAAAAAVADGAFYNAGQSCCAVERIYVHDRIWDRFVAAFVDTVRGYVIGDPLDEQTYIGPLARRDAALAHLDAQVADALGRGARALTGGRRVARPGFFFAPTGLVDVDHTMAVIS